MAIIVISEIRTIPTLGAKVFRYDLRWSIWILGVRIYKTLSCLRLNLSRFFDVATS